MKRRERAIFIGLGVSAALGAALIGWIALGPTQWVTVVVKNASRKSIAAIRVEHEGGVEVAGGLAGGESRRIRFHAIGETSYTLKVRFADGSEMAGQGQYAESGYKFRETVRESGIETESFLIDFFGGW